MAWSKGAIVVVKHGDTDMANAIENGLSKMMVPKEQYDELERDHTLGKIHDDRATDALIADLEARCKRKWNPPKWVDKIVVPYAFVVYWVDVFFKQIRVCKRVKI